MDVFEGHSTNADGREAVLEAVRGWDTSREPAVVLAFCSTRQDAGDVARALQTRFPRAVICGCTTAGEHLSGQHHNGSLVLCGIVSPDIRWAVGVTRDLHAFDSHAASRFSDELLAKLRVSRDDLHPERHFALCFIDGLSMKEEAVASAMADALDGIPLLGGSAGDDLAFKKTNVIVGGEAFHDAAAFLIGESAVPFEVIKHQHYTTTPKSLVITKADVPARRVFEMDGYPAIEAYARALGMPVSAVTNDVTFLNPVTFVCNGEIYVRSIQRVESDGSIVFYCGIEEGMVLSVGGHEDMEAALQRDVGSLEQRIGNVDLFIGFNCILRALEADRAKVHAPLAKIVSRLSKHVIGFDTYGEQLNGLHINQTLVGIAFGGQKSAEVQA